MKKYLTMAAVALMATVMTSGLTACDDGDSDGGSGSALPSPALTDGNGTKLQVRSISGSGYSYAFGYDEDGTLSSIGGVEFEGKTFKIVSERTTSTVTLNGNGLVSKFSEKSDYSNDYGTEKHNLTMSFSYNGSKQLTGATVTGSGSYTSTYNNESESWSGTGTGKLTWSDGNITKAVVTSKTTGMEDGEKFTETYQATYAISYGTKENTFHQMPFFMCKSILDIGDMGGIFAVLGLIGAGPAMLPTGYIMTDIDEDGDEDTETSKYTFTQNAYGAIKTEAKNSSTSISYSYTPLDTRAAAIEEQLQKAMPTIELMGQKMFKRLRK